MGRIKVGNALARTFTASALYNFFYVVVFLAFIWIFQPEPYVAIKALKAIAIFELSRLGFGTVAHLSKVGGDDSGSSILFAKAINVFIILIAVLVLLDATSREMSQRVASILPSGLSYQMCLYVVSTLPLVLELLVSVVLLVKTPTHSSYDSAYNHFAYHIICVDLPRLFGVVLFLTGLFVAKHRGFSFGNHAEEQLFVGGAFTVLIILGNTAENALDAVLEQIHDVIEEMIGSAHDVMHTR